MLRQPTMQNARKHRRMQLSQAGGDHEALVALHQPRFKQDSLSLQAEAVFIALSLGANPRKDRRNVSSKDVVEERQYLVPEPIPAIFEPNIA